MTAGCLPPIPPLDLKRRLDEGSTLLVDIREPDEYARAHIPGARLAPLSALDADDFVRERTSGKAIVFLCRSGNRTAANAARLAAKGFAEGYSLEGGLEAWTKAGLPVRNNPKAPLEIMRQVQIGAGSLVLAGVALGTLVHPGFYGLSAFVGAGLAFAGATGFCGMAKLLALAPWNRAAA
jgi:rhodanese-related sulfurtransferase